MEKELMVKIPLSRYEELINLEARVECLIDYTQGSRFSIDREEVARYLNFKLRDTLKETSDAHAV